MPEIYKTVSNGGYEYIEYSNGARQWYLNGERHRTDGPAVESPDGARQWYLNGERHRTDGPAIEYSDGARQWFLNGKYHRTDGPAIEYSNGARQWFLNGEEITLKTLPSGNPGVQILQEYMKAQDILDA